MNEAQTRAEHIYPALKAAGWGRVEGSSILREHRMNQAFSGALRQIGRESAWADAD